MNHKRKRAELDRQQSLFSSESSPQISPAEVQNPSSFSEIRSDNFPSTANPDDVQLPTSPFDPGIRMGTSSFTAAGWESAFYPAKLKSDDRLSYYASKYNTVEIDSTFYGTPAPSTVQRWAARTPPGFLFAAKIPQEITRQKVLLDCDPEFREFLRVMDGLGDKLGPLLFQFGYFNETVFRTQSDFIARLDPFLKRLPAGYKFAIEIRNKQWLDQHFTDLLRHHSVALALIDHSWMPRPWEMNPNCDLATTDWTYVRWLGDRKESEALTDNRWDKTVVDRQQDLINWAEVFRKFIGRKLQIFAYANNHYSGYGPGTVKLFWNLYNRDTAARRSLAT